MRQELHLLEEFHRAFLRHIEPYPTNHVPQAVKEERIMLLSEEVKEVIEALRNEPIENIAKELCDVLYATYGTIVAFGLTEKMEEAFLEVHRSNMSKLDDQGHPLIREDGKIIKSDKYRPANLKPLFYDSPHG